MENNIIYIYTDGSCQGNPGPGGWAAILKYKKDNQSEVYTKTIGGYSNNTTNNQMELISVIEALKMLKNKAVPIVLTTDSKYVCDAINKNWLYSWSTNNWRTASKQPVKNIDLWKELLELLKDLNISFTWIKGHSGHIENEECDKIAKEQIKINTK